ncbi:hypothetical protein [Pseudonocardia nigra]|uniref:hypothetical protein n=1 Tax=Pseudonocardia nigra TaxID=1921578 RepID=UPI001C5F5431|nr:hypothetical protein [Pseudonocardia nigra]
MTIDDSALDGLRSTLAADDYRLTVTETGTGVEARITAGPDACPDCLVPKPIMRSVLTSALGVPEKDIVLVYPADRTGD